MIMAVSMDDKKWKANQDAEILKEANVITQDKQRHSRAKKAAVQLSKHQKTEAAAMAKVAGKKAKKKVKKSKKSNRK